MKDPPFRSGTVQYVMRTFNWLDRWGILPRPGSLEDQDKTWVEDMEQLSAMKGQVQREYRVFKEAERKRNAGG